MQEKNAARRPPVALVYWPPPPAVWSKLLRTTPLRLHRISVIPPRSWASFSTRSGRSRSERPNAALAMPYPGLRPFEAKDQQLFFGREAQVSDMLAVGGSSLRGCGGIERVRQILAGPRGLLPAVREGFLLGTTDWLTIIIKPGHQPYQRLVRALSRATCSTEAPRALPA